MEIPQIKKYVTVQRYAPDPSVGYVAHVVVEKKGSIERKGVYGATAEEALAKLADQYATNGLEVTYPNNFKEETNITVVNGRTHGEVTGDEPYFLDEDEQKGINRLIGSSKEFDPAAVKRVAVSGVVVIAVFALLSWMAYAGLTWEPTFGTEPQTRSAR